MREIILGAQDNLINVLATVLGVAIGSGSKQMVALAGLASGVAEAISMGGVLYTSTSAERDLCGVQQISLPFTKQPLRAAVVTFLAAAAAGLIPLAPFAFLRVAPAMATSILLSVGALFGLGGWKARLTRRSGWLDGIKFVAIGGIAAVASALIGAALRSG